MNCKIVKGSNINMGKPLEIIVVDDEVQITELIELFMKSSGKESNIHSFNDSVAAREYIRNNNDSIDVVITDYKMPRVNGLELLSVVSKKAKKILISGFVSEIAEDKLNSLKATFFEKPVPMNQLKKVVFDHHA
ncbi:MAG: response regulator [Chitinivibrionales bacterium]|nr:response regulator [Chitinivibrionales bacterium]